MHGNPIDATRAFKFRDAVELPLSFTPSNHGEIAGHLGTDASNAQTNPAVRLATEGARTKADKRTQELISELQVDDPAKIKLEIGEIAKKQRETGKWK